MNTAITFRAPIRLKQQASKAAKELGIPLSLVLKSALKNFAISPKVVFTVNGFTSDFEEEILKSSKTKVKGMSKEKFLKSLMD